MLPTEGAIEAEVDTVRFLKKLITPVLATVVMLAGAAVADEVLDQEVPEVTEEVDGGEDAFEWNDADGVLVWRYDADAQVFIWGDCSDIPVLVAGCHHLALGDTDESEGSETEVGSQTEVGSDTELGSETEVGSQTEVGSDSEIDDSLNHGKVVSGVAHQVKDLEDLGDAKNRGQVISAIAKGTKDLFKDDADDEGEEPEDDEDEESEEESEELDDDLDEGDDGPPEHAKDKGKKDK
jgi:hypothetical protein